jgi:hypothetical protein
VNRELEALARSYARLSHDVGGRISFACDLDDENALNAAEQEKALLDQAFFILGFAALEKHVTLLACIRLADAARRTSMRDAPFDRRWLTSVTIAEEILQKDVSWKAAEREVGSWYKIRSAIAHGQSPSQLADVPRVLYRADEIAATLEEVTRELDV